MSLELVVARGVDVTGTSLDSGACVVEMHARGAEGEQVHLLQFGAPASHMGHNLWRCIEMNVLGPYLAPAEHAVGRGSGRAGNKFLYAPLAV
jgi:hypothetical protein